MNDITISVVSHGQESLLRHFLDDVALHECEADSIVTHNLEHPPASISPRGSIQQIVNPQPKGFGVNHNTAFKYCSTPFFCVANPDVRLAGNPLPALLDCMRDPSVGLIAPLVITPQGEYDGNARRFPTPLRLLHKLTRGHDARYQDFTGTPIPVDWAAGMFMLFRAEAFAAVGGFDEGFHLYYEDVDICARLWKAGWKVVLHPGVHVIHEAQRTSHRNLRYMRWHLTSMARYFRKHLGRLPDTQHLYQP